ncbi:hypothetical protein [Anaerotignum sp.]|uniref:hypothetical protein n=1 Tax=Anaerotignum sp. TaxID=2039241 RepID=UPI002A90F491|nr:hypothetical protein [Anaerotignum sp.]MCI7657207.1 hypothetical protein [Clostridia bacterium]MDY5416318.1 hypothetical protein [Anaerotignum sp.]
MILPIFSFAVGSYFALFQTKVVNFFLSLFVGNIGTIVYLLIYVIIRRKKKKNSDMDQMKIKDL